MSAKPSCTKCVPQAVPRTAHVPDCVIDVTTVLATPPLFPSKGHAKTRATSDCFSSYTAQSTRPTVRPLFTSWSVAVILRGHSIFVTAFLLSPRAGPDGRGYGQPKHDQGGG